MKQSLDENQNIKRWWETFDDGTQMAKDRTGNLNKQIAPDWGEIFNALKG